MKIKPELVVLIACLVFLTCAPVKGMAQTNTELPPEAAIVKAVYKDTWQNYNSKRCEEGAALIKEHGDKFVGINRYSFVGNTHWICFPTLVKELIGIRHPQTAQFLIRYYSPGQERTYGHMDIYWYYAHVLERLLGETVFTEAPTPPNIIEKYAPIQVKRYQPLEYKSWKTLKDRIQSTPSEFPLSVAESNQIYYEIDSILSKDTNYKLLKGISDDFRRPGCKFVGESLVRQKDLLQDDMTWFFEDGGGGYGCPLYSAIGLLELAHPDAVTAMLREFNPYFGERRRGAATYFYLPGVFNQLWGQPVYKEIPFPEGSMEPQQYEGLPIKLYSGPTQEEWNAWWAEWKTRRPTYEFPLSKKEVETILINFEKIQKRNAEINKEKYGD